MRVFIVLVILLIIALIGILRKNPQSIPPSSLSQGIHFTVPYEKKDRFRVKGIGANMEYSLDDLLTNRVVDEEIDHTSVFYDEDLQSDSSINYSANYTPMCPLPATVEIHIYGNIDPMVVKAFYTTKRNSCV